MKPTIGTIIIVAFTLGLACAQEQRAIVPVTDASSPQNLISFSGSVDFFERLAGSSRIYKEHGNVVGRNETSKNVLALVAIIRAAGFRGPGTEMLYRHDFFFKDHGLGPGDTFDIPIDSNLSMKPFNVTTLKSHADAELLFLQFDDGSTWGDQTIAESLIAQRGDVEAYLHRLLLTYTDHGDKAFVAALQDAPKAGESAFAVSQHLLTLYDQFGTPSTVDNVRARLKIASERDASGKF
jgi:hypothetical protein